MCREKIFLFEELGLKVMEINHNNKQIKKLRLSKDVNIQNI